MRKVAVYGASALLVVSSIVGISYAQDTSTPAPSATEAAAAALPPITPLTQPSATRTFLGVSVSDAGTGVTVQRVSPGSPAEAAKLQVGDVILSANGTTVETASDLQKIVEAAASGDVVTLSVQRGTDTLSVPVTLATASVPPNIGLDGDGRDGRGGTFALPTDPLQVAELILHAQLEAVDGGYKVDAVPANNQFKLATDDVITQVNGTAIASVDWTTLIKPPTAPTDNSNNTAPNAPTPTTITLMVTRAGAETTLTGDLRFGRRGGFGGFGGFGDFGGFGGRGDNGQPGGRGGFPGGNGNGQPGGRGGFPGGNGGNFPGGNGGNGNNPPGGNGANGGNFPGGNGQPGGNGFPSSGSV